MFDSTFLSPLAQFGITWAWLCVVPPDSLSMKACESGRNSQQLQGTGRTSHGMRVAQKPRSERRNVMAEPGGNLTDPY